MKYVLLHNTHDKLSRDFICSIPPDINIQIIDWYRDETARWAYIGPPPSAFPTLVMILPNGKQATLREPINWQDHVIPAIENPTIDKFETIVEYGSHIGGQTPNEVLKHIENGHFTEEIEDIAKSSLAKIKK